jgi:hypothetical protein
VWRRKELPWIVGTTALEATHSVRTAVFALPISGVSPSPGGFFQSKGYHRLQPMVRTAIRMDGNM